LLKEVEVREIIKKKGTGWVVRKERLRLYEDREEAREKNRRKLPFTGRRRLSCRRVGDKL